jgi:signal transduction histidine kinase
MRPTEAATERPPVETEAGKPWIRPGAVVIAYLALASAWILLGGKVLDLAAGNDYERFAFFGVVTGLAFVAVTGFVLLLFLRRFTDRLDQANEQARRMARFSELSPNPVVEFGADGAVRSVNSAARDAAAALGLPIEGLLPSGTPELVRRCAQTGEHVSSVRHSVAGRSWRWAFFPAGGGAYGYGYDRTREARLELQVEHAGRMESVGRLAAGVAHDLNNILLAIGGYGALIGLQLPQDDPSQEDLRGIQEQLRHAEELVRKLLLVARMKTPAENMAEVDLADHMPEIAATVRHVLPSHVRMDLDVAPGPLRVEVDVRDLEQAILNLASNAVDAMTEKGVLRIAARPVDTQRICIQVTDTGDGIPPEILPRIFDPFFTTKEEGKGTGLGLASVYAFASRSGGTVEVESHPGTGTTFTILLPGAQIQPAAASMATSASG